MTSRKDKQAKAEYDRQYYASHSEESKMRSRKRYETYPAYYNERNTTRRQELRNFIQQQKIGKSCMRCGNADFRVLDFHHLDKDEKDSGLGQAVSKNWGKERILREIAKCQVLCANCHRIFHWEERQGASPALTSTVTG